MMEALNNLHFIRPSWLLLLIPAALLLVLLWRNARGGQGWRQVIDPQLLPHLLDQTGIASSRSPLPGLALIWLLAGIGMAGPSWQKIPQPVLTKQDALVLVLDLSYSMYAEDLTPNRLERAERKLLDLLEQRTEGTTALLAYAGDSHVVSPLTDDTRTIANLLPALTPAIMPVKGNAPALAIEQALGLLQAAAAPDGHIVLITDGIRTSDGKAINDLLKGRNVSLSVLGVGTGDGGPVPLPRSGLLKAPDGSIVIAALDRQPLRQLAADNNGRYSDISLGDSDLEQVLARPLTRNAEPTLLANRSADRWQDMGYWLALALLPMALLAFRRGWVLVAATVLIMPSEQALALEWEELWRTPDQRGAQLLEQDQAEAAAETFENPDWRAAAAYRAEDYDSAIEHYTRSDDAVSWYNRGNGLAKSGKLPEAIAAYEQALQRNPELEDARFNKELLEQLLEQQQNSEQQQQDSEQEQDSEQQQNSDQQQDSEQQQNPDQQDSEQQQDQNQNQKQQRNQGQQQDPGTQQDNEQQQDGQDQQKPEPEPEPEQKPGQPDEPEQQPEPEQAQPEQPEPKQQPAAQQPGEAPAQPLSAAEQEEQRQKDRETEQWLRRVPDDPAGLLERKFKYESQQNQQRQREDDETIW